MAGRYIVGAMVGLLGWQNAYTQPIEAVPSLSNIVVTATGFEQEIMAAPASITVIPREQLADKAYRDITDALQDVPGISIEGGAGGKIENTQVTIRGMSESYVLFLVDGKPLGSSSEAYYNGFGGGAQVGWLPPLSAIERIEVIRGPMSSLYGSSALGGVINVITKKVADTWSGSVSVDATLQEESGAGNSYQGRFYLSGPMIPDRLGLTVYGSKYLRLEDKFADGYARKDRRDATAQLSWKLTDHQSIALEAGQANHYNTRTPERTQSDMSMNNRRRHLGLDHQVDWGHSFNTKTYLIHEKVDIENRPSQSAYKSATVNTKTVLPLSDHRLTAGAEYKKEETHHDGSRFPGSRTLDLTRWQAALFLEDEYFLSDDFSLTGGLRLDKNEHYGTHVTPRIYGVYHLMPDWVLKGGVSGGFKTPTLKQADSNIVEIAARGAAWDMGNNDLQPERSTNYELGMQWMSETDISAGLTVYQTNFKNKITTETVCTSPAHAPNCHFNGETRQHLRQYVNLDTARLRGVEATLAVPLGPVRLSTNYTLSSSKVTSGVNTGRPLNDMPRHMVNLGLDWRVNAHWQAWAKARYKSKSLEDGTRQRPAYTLVDLGTGYQATKQIRLHAGIYNVLDKKIDNDTYGKTLDGRRYFVGMTVDF